MTDVHAIILVRVDLTSLAHDKAAERPIAVADRELTAPGVVEFVELPDGDLLLAHFEPTSSS